MGRHTRFDLIGRRGVIGQNCVTQSGRVLLGIDLVERRLDEIRVAQQRVAVYIGMAHRFDHIVRRFGGVVTELGERVGSIIFRISHSVVPPELGGGDEIT